jgi:hypothetical protein
MLGANREPRSYTEPSGEDPMVLLVKQMGDTTPFYLQIAPHLGYACPTSEAGTA